ncbi:flagellar hook-basal body complex protein FliE [Gemmata sp. JC717]|uniref:Flagellar hook-basal body complex protein FliE n=1 Tax=Gemmata algarum TaxID=2975278 RepID=A0ABU5F8F4_9BACT|nr:flagellar hook-basal body complex protein FliE [Gemmata algarum]MDY3555256.1 flagellar hook-basal body complex protein FliE [Gemmata algarum]MDY3563042.1 flagellar hook-basal body complex protein FliE [Gemmata algarum]
MPVDSIATVAPLSRLQPLVAPQAPADPAPGGAPFAGVLNSVLNGNIEANRGADAAVQALATGEAQDLHTVSLAVAQADLSFRLILELRNRLTDAFQEVTRMQV